MIVQEKYCDMFVSLLLCWYKGYESLSQNETQSISFTIHNSVVNGRIYANFL